MGYLNKSSVSIWLGFASAGIVSGCAFALLVEQFKLDPYLSGAAAFGTALATLGMWVVVLLRIESRSR